MKNDSVVQTRCKRTTLATILVWYYDQNERIRSSSELTRMALEGFAEILRINGARDISDTEEADKILREFKIDNLNPSGRGQRNLYCNLTGLDSISVASRSARISEIKNTIPQKEDIDSVVRRLLDNYKESERVTIKDIKENLSKHPGVVISENDG